MRLPALISVIMSGLLVGCAPSFEPSPSDTEERSTPASPTDEGRPTKKTLSSDYLVQAGHACSVQEFFFSADSKYLLTLGGLRDAILWDATTGTQLRGVAPPHGHWNRQGLLCEMSPDGTMLILDRRDGNDVTQFDVQSTATGEALCTLPDDRSCHISDAAFSDDSKYVVAAGTIHEADNYHYCIGVWDARSGELVSRSDDPPSHEEDEIQERREELKRLKEEMSLHFSTMGNFRLLLFLNYARPDGRPLRFDGELTLYNATTGFCAPDGKHFVTRDWWDTGSWADDTVFWEIESARPVWKTHQREGEKDIFGFSPDASQFICGIHSDTITLHDANTFESIRTFEGHGAKITKLAYSPDGRTIASGDENGVAYLWDIETGRILHRLPSFFGPIHSIAYRPDGKQVLVAGGGASLSAGEHAPRKLVAETIDGKTSFVLHDERFGCYSPDGSRIFTKKTLWNPETEKAIREVE